MNAKRFIVAVIALFVFVFIYESVVHGMLLTNIYQQTPTVWRDYDQFKALVPFNIAIMASIALWVTFIFTRFYREGGREKGLKFGLYIGVLTGIQAAGAYYYLPISATLAGIWFLGHVIESVIGGFIIGTIYRN